MAESKPAILHRKMMRGGLGRTLLTAFLLLAIGPLSVMSVYAISRTRQESQQQDIQQVALLAESYRGHLLVAAQLSRERAAGDSSLSIWEFDEQGAAQSVEDRAGGSIPEWVDLSDRVNNWQAGGNPLSLWIPVETNRGWQATLLPMATALETFAVPASLAGSNLYLIQGQELYPLEPTSPVLPEALLSAVRRGERAGAAQPEAGVSDEVVQFAVSPLSEGLQLLVARQHGEAESPANALATALVAAALLAALGTTIAAALITRRITQPLYELTRTTVQIARGDLSQRVRIQQDNELGILAVAFNAMTTQLQETLATLEDRVEQRTEELRQANAKIRHRARQLELSAEIGAAISRMHELEPLLEEGPRLIVEGFEYRSAAIWLLGRRAAEDAALALRGMTFHRAVAHGSPNGNGGDPSAPDLAEQAFESGAAVFNATRHTVALPLRLADKLLGSLVLHNVTAFEEGNQPHLQSLADGLSVAIENARASEMERVALEKLHQIEAHRAEFLGEMSQELSTALNSIIGFSHLMLKGVDGPLTDMQRSDLTYINRNGTHLLSLLDGMLDVIDSGQLNEGMAVAPVAEKQA